MGESNFPSMKLAIKQTLGEVYKHAQELSRILSILSIFEEYLELQALVEKGRVRIKFVDRPRTKYFVYPSLIGTTVEIADSTVPIPPHIDLSDKNGSFEYATVPSVIIGGNGTYCIPLLHLHSQKL